MYLFCKITFLDAGYNVTFEDLTEAAKANITWGRGGIDKLYWSQWMWGIEEGGLGASLPEPGGGGAEGHSNIYCQFSLPNLWDKLLDDILNVLLRKLLYVDF